MTSAGEWEQVARSLEGVADVLSRRGAEAFHRGDIPLLRLAANHLRAASPPGEREALTKWSDNVLVSRVGKALREAAGDATGDDIDHGLALLNRLQARGFEIRAASPTTEGGER